MKQQLKDCGLQNIKLLVKLIEAENKKQRKKWGVQNCHIFEWAMWTTEEFGEFIKALNEWNYDPTDSVDEIIREGIQTVTLILKILDALIAQGAK